MRLCVQSSPWLFLAGDCSDGDDGDGCLQCLFVLLDSSVSDGNGEFLVVMQMRRRRWWYEY